MNNLISRQAAIDALRNEENHAFNSYYRGLVKAHKIIADLPPVTPQPKTGHWMRMSDLSEQEDDRYECSRCGNVIHHKNKLDLYTFNSWCGRCGSDNGGK